MKKTTEKQNDYKFPPKYITDPLWKNYKKKQTLTSRNKLIVAYWPWVVKTAIILAKTSEDRMEHIISNASLGIILAIEKYDGRPNVAFRTYAINMIHFAIIRRLDGRHKKNSTFTNMDDFFRLLEQRSEKTIYNEVEKRDTNNFQKKIIQEAFCKLNDREKTIIKLLFWSNYTLEDTGKCFNLTREGVRQIAVKAKAKLKIYLLKTNIFED